MPRLAVLRPNNNKNRKRQTGSRPNASYQYRTANGCRAALLGAGAGLFGAFAARAQQVTPSRSANKEGSVVDTSIDVAVAEKMTAAFTKLYPQIHLQVERRAPSCSG